MNQGVAGPTVNNEMLPAQHEPTLNNNSSSWNSSQSGFNGQGPSLNNGIQSHILCGGCGILLYYSQGANNVRCARCGHITAARNAKKDVAQLVCTGCRVLLMYPRGANSVQCSLCGSINPAQQANKLGHVSCSSCRTTLMYIYGASSVRCAVCKNVTTVNEAASRASVESSSSRAAAQAVLVENPPHDGNEDQFVIGMKGDGDEGTPVGAQAGQLPPQAPPSAALPPQTPQVGTVLEECGSGR